MKVNPLLKKAAWLGAGVTLSQLTFNLAAVLTLADMINTMTEIGLFLLAGSVMTGVLLCWRCSKADATLMTLAVSAYLPLLEAVLWAAAFIQDLLKGVALPGPSLTVMLSQPPTFKIMCVITLIGLVMGLSGIAAQKQFTHFHAR